MPFELFIVAGAIFICLEFVEILSATLVDIRFRREKSKYRRLEFDRRQQIQVSELVTWIVSKEDLILSKLSWAQDSQSELQLNDVRNLLATKPDPDYLHEWSVQLGLDSMLRESLNE